DGGERRTPAGGPRSAGGSSGRRGSGSSGAELTLRGRGGQGLWRDTHGSERKTGRPSTRKSGPLRNLRDVPPHGGSTRPGCARYVTSAQVLSGGFTPSSPKAWVCSMPFLGGWGRVMPPNVWTVPEPSSPMAWVTWPGGLEPPSPSAVVKLPPPLPPWRLRPSPFSP